MSWRSDVALGKYGKLPRALIDKSMFPNVEVDYGSFAVARPCCGLQIPCLDIRFIDARDRLSKDARKRTGVHICRCIRRSVPFATSISCMTTVARGKWCG